MLGVGNRALGVWFKRGEVRSWLYFLCGLIQVALPVLGRFALAGFVPLDRRGRAYLDSRLPLYFLRGTERFRLARLAGTHREGLAEVCRNRTDRSRSARPTGFEVPGGHQPACTSAAILLQVRARRRAFCLPPNAQQTECQQWAPEPASPRHLLAVNCERVRKSLDRSAEEPCGERSGAPEKSQPCPGFCYADLESENGGVIEPAGGRNSLSAEGKGSSSQLC